VDAFSAAADIYLFNRLRLACDFECELEKAMASMWQNTKASVANILRTDSSKLEYSAEEQKIFAASARIGWTIFFFAVGGDVAIWMWASGASTGTNFMALLGADLLVAAAAAAVGSLFGFVFGIPRTVDPATRAAVVASANQGGNSAASNAVLATNTNLERISDWLTTLLIGATLVQIKEITTWVGQLGQKLMAGGVAANEAVVPIIIIYFFALSFLGVYLITRLYLTSALGFGGRGALVNAAKPLSERISAAAGSSSTEDQKRALKEIDAWQSTGEKRDDPELNANAARIIIKLINAKAVQGREADLTRFLNNAVKDPGQKAKLQVELSAGALATGTPNLDAAIKQALQ
jgi:hypothetical protein